MSNIKTLPCEFKDGHCVHCGDTEQGECEGWNTNDEPPYAWAIDACSKMWIGEYAELDAKAEAKRCGGTCKAFPLFRKDQS